MSSRLNRALTMPALAIPAALLFALTACATPGAGSGDAGSGGGGTDGAGGGDGAGSATGIECLTDRTWSLDLNDLVGQLADQMSASVAVSEATASGSQTITFSSDGTAVGAIDSTFVMTVDSNGLPLTITQTHSGAPQGGWSEASEGTVSFDEWDDSGYTIDNEISVDGTVVDMPIELPPNSFGGSTMSYECSGSTLTTTVPENTATYRWSTED